jgi:hypothetical protein
MSTRLLLRFVALLSLPLALSGCNMDLLTGASDITYQVTGSSATRVSLTYETESV